MEPHHRYATWSSEDVGTGEEYTADEVTPPGEEAVGTAGDFTADGLHAANETSAAAPTQTRNVTML
jgi:hypothetical protein